MRKKKSKSIPKKTISSKPADPKTLAEQATQHQAAGHYKEAIELYKKLYAEDSNDQWRDCLAICYLERARQFAQRNMLKEALVIWDNYVQFSSNPNLHLDHYILWQISLNQIQAAQNALQKLDAKQLDTEFAELSVILGFLMLTEQADLSATLPTDSKLYQHWQIVKQALQTQDVLTLNEQLKALPFKSPFRDFRTLASAFSKLIDAPEQSLSLFNKIPSNSVYAPAAQLLHLLALPENDRVQALIQLPGHSRRQLVSVCGFSEAQTQLIEARVKEPQNGKDKFFFNLAIQFKELFGINQAREFCQNTLSVYPAGKKDFQKHFGSVSSFEENRIKALKMEEKQAYHQADKHWRLCIQSLQNEIEQNPHHALRIALICRHMAIHHPIQEDRILLLKRSLEFDPQDKETYLKVLELIDQLDEDPKDYKDWLAQTEAAFPKDIEVLTLLMQSAFSKQAYKKAVQYAQKILKIDPLNSLAKTTALEGHLNHARKSLKSKKYDLATKEVEQAKNLNPNKNQTQLIGLIECLIGFASADKQAALEQLPAIVAELHHATIHQHLRISAEALQCGLPLATLLRPLPAIDKALLTETQFSELLQQIQAFYSKKSDIEWITKALDRIKKPLKAALKPFSQNEPLLLRACETFAKIDQFTLIGYCLECYRRPDTFLSPLMGYYGVYADTKGNPERCNYLDVIRLQNYLNDAQQAHDHKTAVLIMNYLDAYYDFKNPAPSIDFGNMAEEIDDFFSHIDRLFAHVPEKTMERLFAESSRLTSRYTQDSLMDQLLKDYKNKPHIIAAAIANPDIFGILLLLKAADNLNIDVDVTAEDVIELSHTPRSSFPFPF